MQELKLIKKYYGEDMMHFIRECFPKILEKKGLMLKILTSSFAPNKMLYKDIIKENKEKDFISYIYYLLDEKEEEYVDINKSPFELMKMAGYSLYKCETEEEIQSFKHYYRIGERLCTFKGNRLNTNFVFFAVKDNLERIKRSKHPDRDDEYGTSVISIQFSRLRNMISIKNRYNDKVPNPDNTFNNNLDNIIPGLTKSFCNYYGYDLSLKKIANFEIKNYIKTKDGKYYKYNYEINNIYYCSNNIIIDNDKIIYDYSKSKERYIILDYLIVDLSEKTIKFYDNKVEDSIINRFNDSKGNSKIKNIALVPSLNKSSKMLIIKLKDDSIIYIEFDKENKIISYKDDNLLELDDNYLYENKYLENINIKNVTRINDNILYKNTHLKKIKSNKIISIGKGLLYNNNNSVREADFPNVVRIDDDYMPSNKALEEANYESLEYAGNNFLKSYTGSKTNFRNLTIICDSFMEEAENVEELIFDNAKYIGDKFFYKLKKTKKTSFKNVEIIQDYFLESLDDID